MKIHLSSGFTLVIQSNGMVGRECRLQRCSGKIPLFQKEQRIGKRAEQMEHRYRASRKHLASISDEATAHRGVFFSKTTRNVWATSVIWSSVAHGPKHTTIHTYGVNLHVRKRALTLPLWVKHQKGKFRIKETPEHRGERKTAPPIGPLTSMTTHQLRIPL